MASNHRSVILKIFVLICVLQLQLTKVNAIRCFQCNSNNNSGCTTLENYKKQLFYPEDCEDNNGQAAFCRKTVIQVFDKTRHYDPRVIRSCGYIPHKHPCYRADNEGHYEEVCQCFDNGCNSAGIFNLPYLLIGSSVCLLKIVFH